MAEVGAARSPMTTAALLEAATRSTGLHDIGGERARNRFERLVAFADMTPGDATERAASFDRLLRILIGRLRFVADRANHPGIVDEQIERPVIVMGLGRSGTTLLQALLARDHSARAPRYWEMMFPSPPPGLAEPDDPRVAAADKMVADTIALYPDLLAAHPYLDEGGMSLIECENLWESSPAFVQGFLETSAEERYAFHREFLQHLQYGAPARRWVLKGLEHQWHLSLLRSTYPDGLFVWIHRDPSRAYASMIEYLSVAPRRGVSAEMDQATLARRYLESLRKRLLRALADPEISGDGICHVLYRDLTASPVAEVRRIYDHFGMDASPGFDDELRSWLADPSNRSDRHGRFRYGGAPVGVERDEIDAAFAEYRERFRIPDEPE